MATNVKEKVEKYIIHCSPTVLEWMNYGLCCLIVLVTMYYKDNCEIFVDAVHHIDALVYGESLEVLGINSLPYGVFHQWIIELWSIPVCIFHYLCGLDYLSIPAIIWYKLCVVFFAALCIMEFKKLCILFEMNKDQISWMVLLLCSNILVFLSVFHVAQTDVLYLLLIIKGYIAFLNHDKRKFVICFMIANSFKFISIFVFIPLLLLSEKKIYKILSSFVMGVLVIPLQQIWYRIVNFVGKIVFPSISVLESDSIVQNAVASSGEHAGAMNHFYSKVFDNMLYIVFPGVRKEYNASFLIFIFVLICLWCYIKPSNEAIKRDSILAINTVFLLFFLSTSPNPYWVVLLYPFLFIAIFMCTNAIKIQLLLEKVFTWSLFLTYVMSTYWVYGGAQTFDNLILNKIGICKYTHYLQGEPNIAGYLNKINIGVFMPIVTAVCIAAAVGMLYVFYKKDTVDEVLSDRERICTMRSMLWGNQLLIVGWFVINVVLLRKY